MNRNEILLNSIWVEGKLNVFSPFFDREVTLFLYPSMKTLKATESILSDKFVEAINDFINLSTDSLPLMQQLLYKHCLQCCEDISYGFDLLPGETETEANLREFGVASPEDAFAQANLRRVSVSEDDLRVNRFVKITFYPAWEDEHGCELVLKNGLLLDYAGESGTYLGQFDFD